MTSDASADSDQPLADAPDGTAMPRAVTLRRIDPARNMARFYAMDVQRDLFGAILLMRQWGRIGTYGRVAMEAYTSIAAALAVLERQAERKRRRGYR
jgi:predicted DNA-binding WGR domain protein